MTRRWKGNTPMRVEVTALGSPQGRRSIEAWTIRYTLPAPLPDARYLRRRRFAQCTAHLNQPRLVCLGSVHLPLLLNGVTVLKPPIGEDKVLRAILLMRVPSSMMFRLQQVDIERTSPLVHIQDVVGIAWVPLERDDVLECDLSAGSTSKRLRIASGRFCATGWNLAKYVWRK